MEKCAVCKKRIDQTFLKKILGSYFKNEKGKKFAVCSGCQKKLDNDKEKIFEAIK